MRPIAALVTGASSGIGRAVAIRLAKAGMDLFLVGRDQAALQAVAQEVSLNASVKAHFFATDLSLPGAGTAVAQHASEQGLDIGILVNNAGFTIHRSLSELDTSLELRLVDLQAKATVELTNAFLPDMLLRREGRILNVSSVYAACPVASQAVYGACKAFMHSYSAALSEELRGSGVTVTVLTAGATVTRLRARAGIGAASGDSRGMSAEAVAEAGVRAMMEGRLQVVPGNANKIIYAALSVLPLSFKTKVLRRVNDYRLRAGD